MILSELPWADMNPLEFWIVVIPALFALGALGVWLMGDD